MSSSPRGSAVASAALFFLVGLFPADGRSSLTPALLLLLAMILVSRNRSGPGSLELAVFVGLAALSVLDTPTPHAGIRVLLSWLTGLGLFVVMSGVSARQLGSVPSLLAVSLGLHAGLQRWWLLPNLAESLQAPESVFEELVLQRAAGGRAFATYLLPGHLGAALAALVPLVIAEAARTKGWRRGGALLALAAAALGLYAAAALGALLVLAAFAALRAWHVGRRPQTSRWRACLSLLLALALIAAVAWMRAPQLVDWQSPENPVRPRIVQWQRALSVIASSPVVGAGLGAYPTVWLQHAKPGDVPARNAHMSYLEVAAELGVPALLVLAAALLAALSASRGAARLGAGILLVHAAFDFDLQSPGLLALSFCLLGLGIHEEALRPVGRIARLSLCGALLAGALLGIAAEIGSDPIPEDAAVATRLEAARGRIRVWPLDVHARAALVSALRETRQLDSALAELRIARSLEPRTAWLCRLEAELQLERGEPFAAFFALAEARRLYPARPEYVQRMGELEQSIRSATSAAPPRAQP